MKAVVLDKAMKLHNLSFREIEKPVLTDGKVIVKV